MANVFSAMMEAPAALARVMSPLTLSSKIAFDPVALISRAPEVAATI